MLYFTTTFTGLHSAIRYLQGVQDQLRNNLSGGFERTKRQIYADIVDIFETKGQGVKHIWPDWSPITKRLRGGKKGYYGVHPGPVQDQIGVWTGQLKAALVGGTSKGIPVPPGFVHISGDTMQMGITKGTDRKYDVFIMGRPGRSDTHRWYHTKYGLGWEPKPLPGSSMGQPGRAIYDNLELDSDTEDNPAIRGFKSWLMEDLGLGH